MAVLSKTELQAAGFNEASSEWATLKGVVQTPVEITTATHTAVNDAGVFYIMNSATAQTLTIPTGLTNVAVGGVITVLQKGVGMVTIEAAVGVTIEKSSATLNISAQYKTVQILKLGVDQFVALGSFS
jgi:hypothetical protein